MIVYFEFKDNLGKKHVVNLDRIIEIVEGDPSSIMLQNTDTNKPYSVLIKEPFDSFISRLQLFMSAAQVGIIQIEIP